MLGDAFGEKHLIELKFIPDAMADVLGSTERSWLACIEVASIGS